MGGDGGGGLFSRFRKLDIYRDVPSDLTEQTVSGALVSVFAVFFCAYLFITEVQQFMTVVPTQEMFVDATPDTGNAHSMIRINMNITVPQIPCAVVSVDAQDVMGSHVVDVGGELKKTRLSAQGKVQMERDGVTPMSLTPPDVLEMKGEGCNIHGHLIVKRVPGNFHVSAHAHADLLQKFFGPNAQLDVSHHIHDLSFGDPLSETVDIGYFGRDFVEHQVNPLAGQSKTIETRRAQTEYVSYEYFIKIVPTLIEAADGVVHQSYQFVANSNEIVGRYRLSTVYFRYDLSPITVKFAQRKSSTVAHFLVQVCAIVGGVFTVLGLINSVTNTALKRVLKKAQVGKLG